MTRVLLLCLIAAGCAAAPPVRVENEAFDVIEEVRRALGAEALFAAREGITLSGTRLPADAGPERPISVSLTPSGRFLMAVGGAASLTRGFDGSDAWVSRPSGVVRHLALGTREHLLADGWLRTHLWLVPGSEHFAVEIDEEKSDESRIALELSRAAGRLNASVEIDRLTMLPASFELTRFGRTRRVSFGDWSSGDSLGGARFAQTVEERVDGVLIQSDRFEGATLGTPPTFRAPINRPSDTEFNGLSSGALLTRVDPEGRFHVKAQINGMEVGWMLVDSGFGAHALRRDRADELGLTTVGGAVLAGAGGSGSGAWGFADELELGPLRVNAPRFALIEAELDADVVGILGAPLFERAVVSMDQQSGMVTLYDPVGFRGRGLPWEPIVRDGSATCVRGRIGVNRRWTEPCWLRLDTGSDDTLTVARWASGGLGLDFDRTLLRPATLVGLFGRIEGWRTPIQGLEFAGSRSGQTEVSLLRDETTGPLSDPWIAGNLGMGALRGRRVTFDLTRDRIAVSDGP